VLHARPVLGRSLFSGVPLTEPETLRSVTPRPVAANELDAAAALWRAYVSESPADLARLVLARSVGPLADRMVHFLPRFPARHDGLTVWERRLLTRLRDHTGETTPRIVGSVLGAKMEETPDDIGDGTLFDLLLEMGASGLLEVEGDREAMRSTRFAITALGSEVLEGRANRVAEVGFGRWIGGTHLDASSGAPFWWFDEGTLVQAPVPEARGWGCSSMPTDPRSTKTRSSESRRRRGGKHCPVCLLPLTKNAPRTRLQRRCTSCGAQPQPQKSCNRCRGTAGAIWQSAAGVACSTCGHHGKAGDVLARS
jgi:hypothetical protein